MTNASPERSGHESTTHFDVQAILFDLDGTLIDSTVATERAWTSWGGLMGLSGYRHTVHGLTAQSLVNELIAESRRAEALELIARLEIQDTDGIQVKDGVRELLQSLPAESWTIVTSCTSALAAARMGAASLGQPEHMVTADQITTGKPSPEGFLLAAERLGVDIARCLVVEDAPAGISAGKAAGAGTLAVTGTYGSNSLDANVVVESLSQIAVSRTPMGTLRVSINN
ncbi:HAD-IA family hydrolase [Paeniglutamicibacter sulfureus]|uniref:Sugar-phosphatase n=1 Tax=Paeniglutamicibacter sulfureus TaxID=43666 RepID=A0ABU2BHD7_9MICC|nr:HAD-IA family hydrolase [Paeniglutamicibacter sulfureus]MDO2933642.1 HAD-IA family hydrolase [Paeniglutamicibacter sulfureus]MDR7358066.1 sugar-phosphatase [Paeniglutamicibacter sulfureus]